MSRHTEPELYVSKAVTFGSFRDRSWFYCAGSDPMNVHAFDRGLLGDHARWWLKLQMQYQRWPWWRPIPPPVSTLRIVDAKPVDRPIAWVLTAYAVWRALR